MNIHELPIHPAANAFPMLSEAELNELATDIKASGLIRPIIVAKDDGGVLCIIDGRNRREACKIAGVEPHAEEHVGDIESYIYSENIARRHLTTSQKAMGEARLFPEGRKGNQYTKSASCDITSSTVGQQSLSRARSILKNAPDLADKITDGSLFVSKAYDDMRIRLAAKDKGAEVIEELKNNAPDLYEMVEKGTELATAYKAYQERLESAKCNRLACLRSFENLVESLDRLAYPAMRADVINGVASDEFIGILPSKNKDEILKALQAGVVSLTKLTEEINEKQNKIKAVRM